MKKITFLLITFLLIPLYANSQFQVIEKVEVYVSYEPEVRKRINKVFLSNSRNRLFSGGIVDSRTNRCVMYDVKPGKYLFGFDIGDELVVGQHMYAIKYNPISHEVYSEIYYENKVDIRENLNLVIHLFVANEKDYGMGIIKREELKKDDYDIVYFDYYIPSNVILNKTKINSDVSGQKAGFASEKETVKSVAPITMQSGDCRSKLRYDTQYKQFYEDYFPLFSDERYSYCYCTEMCTKTITIEEADIKYKSDCDKLKIKKVTINFFKRADIINQNLDPSDFGRQGVTVSFQRYGSVINTRDCEQKGNTCVCKFDGTFMINIQHGVYIRDEFGIQKMLCTGFFIPCILGNVFSSNNQYMNTPAHIRNFRDAMMDHEKLHCVQFSMLIEAFFKDRFGSGMKPFYFGNKSETDFIEWNGKTLADRICESIEDAPCCNPSTGECDKNLCMSKEESIRNEAGNMMIPLIEERFESFEGTHFLELPAWHFTFLRFNFYKWGLQPCD